MMPPYRVRPAFVLTPFSIAIIAAAAVAQDKITRMSVDSSGGQSNNWSGTTRPAISADGRFVAFDSDATNLVPFDQNGHTDVFVHDRQSGATVRMSVDVNGGDSNSGSYEPSLSDDGRYVAFTSDANDLVSSDTNNINDVFVRDRDPDGNGIFDEGNGVTTLVSVSSAGAQVRKPSERSSISGDGNRVSFVCSGELVTPDTNRTWDVFVRDRALAQTIRVSVDSNGGEANDASYEDAISADGNVVAFGSVATNLVSGDTNHLDDVFTHDLISGVTSRVSVDSSGAESNGISQLPSISHDGSILSFRSQATNLVSGDSNGTFDVFVHDQTSGITERVSVDSTGAQANDHSDDASISADGSRIAFASYASNLVPGDSGHTSDIFVRDRAIPSTTVSSVSCVGLFGDDASVSPAISAGGTLVAFSSSASNLVDDDTNKKEDVFVDDRTVAVIQASWSNYGAGFPGTLGIPSLTSSGDPAFGASISIDVGNSLGSSTVALVLAGFGQASISTRAGGTILVDMLLTVPVGVPPSGASLPVTIPYDIDLCGVSFDLQAIELDPGAQAGLSFTAGLELAFGQ